MGEPRVCFDTSVYQRALADAEAMGFGVSRDEIGWETYWKSGTDIKGKYYCDDSATEKFLIDLGRRVTGYSKGNAFWTDSAGRMFQIIEPGVVPQGISAIVWGNTKGTTATEDLMYESIREFYRCEAKGNKKCVEDVKKNIVAERAQIDAREKADVEAKRQKEVAAERAAERQRQGEIADYIRKGNAIWAKAQELIDLAEECDGGPGGIDPDDLKEIRNEYLAKKAMPTNLEDAKQYYEQAKEMFKEMVNDSSGHASLREKGETIGCSLKRTYTDDHPSCGSGETRVSGGYENISCNDIGILEINRWSAYCLEKPEKPEKPNRYENYSR